MNKQHNQKTIITNNSFGIEGDYNERSLTSMLAYLEKAELSYWDLKLKNTKRMINKMVKK